MSTDGREPQQVWLAGEDGPPGMITPAEPRQDAVYHPENIPGSRDAMPRPRQAAVDTALAASDLVLQYRDATAIGLERMEL